MFFEKSTSSKNSSIFQQGLGDILFLDNMFYGIGTHVKENNVVLQYCMI